MTSIEEFDIAIIGGGMVGASLASLLAASGCGWRIALIEANPFLSVGIPASYAAPFDARSTALSYGSVEILRELGLWEQLQQHATPIRQVHVSDRGHLSGSVIDAREQGIDAVGHVLENTWLGNVLAAHVQQQSSIVCFSPARVQSLTPRQQGTRLQVVCEGEAVELNCRLAVIADGGDSPLRHTLGIETETKDYRQTALIANVEFTQPHGGVAFERFTDQGPLALLPLGDSEQGQRAALVWTLPPEEALHHQSLDDAAFLAQLQQRFGHRLGRFTRVSPRHAFPLRLITAREQVRSGVVLVGNAAHFLHPVAGQGFNLALRDAAVLTETLIELWQQEKSPGDLAGLQRYMERQQRDQMITITFSDRLVRLFSSSRLPLIALRHLGFISLAALPPAKRYFAELTMGVAGRSPRWRNLESEAESS